MANDDRGRGATAASTHGDGAGGLPKVLNFSLVIETLNVSHTVFGRCPVVTNGTLSQQFEFTLSPELAAAVPSSGLAVWRSTEEEQFVSLPPVHPTVGPGGVTTVRINLDADAM